MTDSDKELFDRGAADFAAGRNDSALYNDFERGRPYREGMREARFAAEKAEEEKAAAAPLPFLKAPETTSFAKSGLFDGTTPLGRDY